MRSVGLRPCVVVADFVWQSPGLRQLIAFVLVMCKSATEPAPFQVYTSELVKRKVGVGVVLCHTR